MNNTELLTWGAFKATLKQYPDLKLQFKYAEGKYVDASYHITEIKQAPIVSVDCGGVMNAWTEVIIQLWEPAVKSDEPVMQVNKALSIISLVEKTLPLNPIAIVKIEFGNAEYDTRQMYPADVIINAEEMIVSLTPDYTQCKAIGRGGSCGTTVSGEECCTPLAQNIIKKPKIELFNLASGESCTPGSGCC